MKCPYCHIEFNSQKGYKAHVDNCMHKEDTLPEPEKKVEINLEEMAAKKIIPEITGIDEKDYLNKLLKEEKEGKERKTVIEAIEDRLETLEEK